MSSPPNRFATCLIMAFTLVSSVTSQGSASARTPKLRRSINARCASLADVRKVMATSAPASAKAKALARPSRRAPPVISATLPARRVPLGFAMPAILSRHRKFPPQLWSKLPSLTTTDTGCFPWRNWFVRSLPILKLHSSIRCYPPRKLAPGTVESHFMAQARQVVVYSRKGCHLCEIVKETLGKLERRGGFTWREIDVDGGEQLRRPCTDQGPVV